MVMNPKDSYVYVHRRETDGSVFYVGKGTGNRAWSASKRNKHWVSVTSKHGCNVQIIQDGLQSWYAYEVEVEVLSRLLEAGVKLTNKTDGGDGCMGYKHTDAQKQVAVSRAKTQWEKPEYRLLVIERVAAAQKKLWQNPEYKQARIRAMRENCDKVARSQKMSAASARRWHDKELASRMKESMRLAANKPDRKAKTSERIREMWKDPSRLEALRDSKRELMKPVKCVDMNHVFDSIKAAVRWLVARGFSSASPGNLRSACAGKLKTAYGFTWAYA